MKLALIAASIAATANSQALKVDATCVTTGVTENLVLEIPYPDERTAKLLSLEAGDCDATNYGGSLTWAAGIATVKIPIDSCNMRGELYGTPVVARSYGLYRPTATVTFGQRVGEIDVIFRSLPIAAECGKKTSYTVEFNYNNVTAADTEGCTIIDGVCVFPAHTDDAVFTIQEYTDDTFLVEVDEDNRAILTGTQIFLSLQVTGLTDELKFAVTECKVVDGEKELVLLNPGSETNPTCKIDELGLSANYEKRGDDYLFNFQHLLFLMRRPQETGLSTFRLECSVEICEKNDASSKCNSAAAVCINSSTDVLADAADERESYMCDGACENNDECSSDVNTFTCKTCTCDHGIASKGKDCPVDGTENCSSCESDYILTGTTCVTSAALLSSFRCENEVSESISNHFATVIKQLHEKSCDNIPTASNLNTEDFESSFVQVNSTYGTVVYLRSVKGMSYPAGEEVCKSNGFEIAQIFNEVENLGIFELKANEVIQLYLGATRFDDGVRPEGMTDENRSYIPFMWHSGLPVCIDGWHTYPTNPDVPGFLATFGQWPADGQLHSYPNFPLPRAMTQRVACEYRCSL